MTIILWELSHNRFLATLSQFSIITYHSPLQHYVRRHLGILWKRICYVVLCMWIFDTISFRQVRN